MTAQSNLHQSKRDALTYLLRWRDEPDHDEQHVMDAIAVLSMEHGGRSKRTVRDKLRLGDPFEAFGFGVAVWAWPFRRQWRHALLRIRRVDAFTPRDPVTCSRTVYRWRVQVGPFEFRRSL